MLGAWAGERTPRVGYGHVQNPRQSRILGLEFVTARAQRKLGWDIKVEGLNDIAGDSEVRQEALHLGHHLNGDFSPLEFVDSLSDDGAALTVSDKVDFVSR